MGGSGAGAEVIVSRFRHRNRASVVALVRGGVRQPGFYLLTDRRDLVDGIYSSLGIHHSLVGRDGCLIGIDRPDRARSSSRSCRSCPLDRKETLIQSRVYL